MYILYVGITYKNTPLKLREKVTFFDRDLVTINQQLAQEKSILENVILSTCNRTEVYAVVDQLHTGRYYIKHFLAEHFQLPIEQLAPYLVYKENQEALMHCFRVGCGLDSMILGETQILGQLKHSFLAAQESQTTGVIFNHLFNEMIAFAKKMHTKYKINERSASVSQAALHLAKTTFSSLQEKHLGIIGAGEMGGMLLKNTANSGFKKISLFNRTLAHACQLQKESNQAIKVYPFSTFYEHICELDIVIAAVSTEKPLIKRAEFSEACQKLTHKILLIDIGVPRNIDPHCSRIEQVTLYDIDQLNRTIQQNNQERLNIVKKITSEVTAAVTNFEEWEKQLGIIPIIKSLREQTLQAEEQAMTSLIHKLPNLTERELKVIRKHMKSIVNQTLRAPIKEIKELSTKENAAYDIQVFQKIFGMKDAIDERRNVR